jgi:hypothetical protein
LQFAPSYSDYVLYSDGGPADNVKRKKYRGQKGAAQSKLSHTGLVSKQRCFVVFASCKHSCLLTQLKVLADGLLVHVITYNSTVKVGVHLTVCAVLCTVRYVPGEHPKAGLIKNMERGVLGDDGDDEGPDGRRSKTPEVAMKLEAHRWEAAWTTASRVTPL